jgi:glyoxylase-like metal-dependent hydrolase (beta-lactamase superfamily II)
LPLNRAGNAFDVAAPVVTRINDNVVRLGTSIVNWYLLADDEGVTVVDAAIPAYRSQLGAGLRELGRTLPDVKAVVLTHAHADHVGFAEQLRQELDIPVYVHREDEELATTAKQFGKNDGSMVPYFRYPAAYRLLFELAKGGGAKPRPIERVTRFGDGEELPVPGRPRTIHTPGHTAGHTALVAADVLFAGDALCTRNPLTGKRGPQLMPSAFNRSTKQALASLENLVGAGASVLVPGHGNPVREPNGAVEDAKRRGPT